MKYVTKPMMSQLISNLRGLAPRQPHTYGQALQIARWQGARLRTCEWLNVTEPDINLSFLCQQRAVPVNFVPSYVLSGESGLTTDQISGRLEIYVNEQEPPVRQRFTLLHEFKHALDFAQANVLHERLGVGNTRVQDSQIEAIANEFAANVLMPTAMVTRAWFRTQDLRLCAKLFNVSAEAMHRRLTNLGLIERRKMQRTVYFRGAGRLAEDVSEFDLSYLNIAA
jgi:hypothetical protein